MPRYEFLCLACKAENDCQHRGLQTVPLPKPLTVWKLSGPVLAFLPSWIPALSEVAAADQPSTLSLQDGDEGIQFGS